MLRVAYNVTIFKVEIRAINDCTAPLGFSRIINECVRAFRVRSKVICYPWNLALILKFNFREGNYIISFTGNHVKLIHGCITGGIGQIK